MSDEQIIPGGKDLQDVEVNQDISRGASASGSRRNGMGGRQQNGEATAKDADDFQLNGFHNEIMRYGDSYKGQFRDGKRHGKGVYTSGTGDKYDGEWKHGEMHGKGVYFWNNGDRHEGEFRHNQRNGAGVFTKKAGGETFTGTWKNDWKHGHF